MNWETLMCFGDSITKGARSYCSYPEYTGFFLEKEIGNRWNVINHSECGFTAMDLAKSISNNFGNFKDHNPSLISIMAGTNDLKSNTTLKNFEIAYNQIIIKSKLLIKNDNIVLIRIPHFPPKIMYPYNYNMNERIIDLNGLINIIADKHGLRVIEFSLKPDDLYDGVHLNEQGAIHSAGQLTSFILKDKGIEHSDEYFIQKHFTGSLISGA
jgi:lysophospholipase L1-like esterase